MNNMSPSREYETWSVKDIERHQIEAEVDGRIPDAYDSVMGRQLGFIKNLLKGNPIQLQSLLSRR